LYWYWVLDTGCWVLGNFEVLLLNSKLDIMASYRDLEIYKIAFKLSIRVHRESLKLPNFELFEQGSQIRRSSKSIKDTIAEGFGRRKYKAEYIF